MIVWIWDASGPAADAGRVAGTPRRQGAGRGGDGGPPPCRARGAPGPAKGPAPPPPGPPDRLPGPQGAATQGRAGFGSPAFLGKNPPPPPPRAGSYPASTTP